MSLFNVHSSNNNQRTKKISSNLGVRLKEEAQRIGLFDDFSVFLHMINYKPFKLTYAKN